jgi:hypothetical protein
MENQVPLDDIAQRIAVAIMSPPDEAVLKNQDPFNPEEQTDLGILPEHLRNLAVLYEECISAAKAAHAVWRDTPDDSEEDRIAHAVLVQADDEAKAVHKTFFAAIAAHIKPNRDEVDGMRLTSDWHLVAMTREPEDDMRETLRQALGLGSVPGVRMHVMKINLGDLMDDTDDERDAQATATNSGT